MSPINKIRPNKSDSLEFIILRGWMFFKQDQMNDQICFYFYPLKYNFNDLYYMMFIDKSDYNNNYYGAKELKYKYVSNTDIIVVKCLL